MLSDSEQRYQADLHRVYDPTAHDAIYLLRTVQQHHVQLSSMADQKAGFLIGGSIVMLGLVLGQIQSTDSYGLLLAGASAMLTLALAIYAVMPRYGPSRRWHPAKPNKMFFGVFASMDEELFISEQMEMLHDSEEIHRVMLRDIHQMGSSLYRMKFRYLSYSFRFALVGLGLSFIVALVEFFVG